MTTCAVGGLDCQPVLENGLASTGGEYAQVLPAAPAPVGTYMVEVSAPGYLANFTWINITRPGAFYTAPAIRLSPVYPPVQPQGAPPPIAASSEYLFGSVVDRLSGEGVPGALFTLTPQDGGTATVLEGSVSDSGSFNFSVAAGQYLANITAPDYYSLTTFLNLSGYAPGLDAGVLGLAPFGGFATGLVRVLPDLLYGSLYHLGPGDVAVTVCLRSDPGLCGTGLDDSSGFFRVPAPTGVDDSVTIEPDALPFEGSAAGGFVGTRAEITVRNGSSPAFLTVGLTLFGELTGNITDASAAPGAPLRFGQVSASVSLADGQYASAGETLTGGGAFTLFLPPGRLTGVVAGSAYVPATFASPAQVGNITAPGVEWYNASLVHFGWVTGWVRATQPPEYSQLLNVSDATVGLSGWDAEIGAEVGSTGPADGNGYFNVTAPPVLANLTASGPDYSPLAHPNETYIPVNASQTFVFPFWDPVSLVPWGYVSGEALDPVLHHAIPYASVAVTDVNQSRPSNPASVSAADGRFFTDAAPTSTDVLTVGETEELTNVSTVAVTASNITNVGGVDLTGYGIVAGRVLGSPGNLSLSGAEVSVCPLRVPECPVTTTTNGQGIFWALVPPGPSIINASAPGYVHNATATITAVTDAWRWFGPINLTQLGMLRGLVIGVPSGTPLAGATVQVCALPPPGGTPDTFCVATVETNSAGTFGVSVVAGSYVVEVAAAGYGPTSLTSAVAPGESVDLGTILLALDGSLTGIAEDADGATPIANATVFGCPTVPNGELCVGATNTNASGGLTFTAAPGTYTLAISALGYQDAYAVGTIQSGRVRSIGPIDLIPVGPDTLFAVRGAIFGAGNSLPIPGATVVSVGGYASEPTGPTGTYSIDVPWGSYTFVVSALGFFSTAQSVVVHGNRTNVNFTLAPSVYPVSGRITDGLSGRPLADVAVSIPYVASTTTNASGGYAFELGNGTYVATVTAPEPENESPVSVTLAVDGTPVVRSVALFPAVTTVDGLVASVGTGLPIAGAVVHVSGTTASGVPWSASYVATPLGRLTIPVYPGQYELNASAPGYAPVQQPLTITGQSSVPVLLTLSSTPTASVRATSAGIASSTEIAAGVVVVIAAVGLAGIAALRRRPPVSLDEDAIEPPPKEPEE